MLLRSALVMEQQGHLDLSRAQIIQLIKDTNENNICFRFHRRIKASSGEGADIIYDRRSKQCDK